MADRGAGEGQLSCGATSRPPRPIALTEPVGFRAATMLKPHHFQKRPAATRARSGSSHATAQVGLPALPSHTRPALVDPLRYLDAHMSPPTNGLRYRFREEVVRRS
jgi:hypothetical protein